MIGQLAFTPGGRGRLERGELYGLPILQVKADPCGWLAQRRLRRAGRNLWREGIQSTLVPGGFDQWAVLEDFGLSPVNPAGLLQAQSVSLTVAALQGRGLAPERATVALRGVRAGPEMARAAARLCSKVRYLVISAPRGGEELAVWLRREFGMPIVPRQEQAQLALRFHAQAEPGTEESLELYGTRPHLAGLSLDVPRLAEEDRRNLSVLYALWRGGRLGEEEIILQHTNSP